jgi:hypothetical protein
MDPSSLKEIIAHQATWKIKTLSQRSASTHSEDGLGQLTTVHARNSTIKSHGKENSRRAAPPVLSMWPSKRKLDEDVM